MVFKKKERIEPPMVSLPQRPPGVIEAEKAEGREDKTYLLDVTDNEEFSESFVIIAGSIIQALQKFTLKAEELDFKEISIDIQVVEVIQ